MSRTPIHHSDDEASVDAVLAAFDGDPRAAIAAMLDDIDALCGQIDRASLFLSRGFTRGWKPCWHRVGGEPDSE